jgi:hypothetical protein
MGWVFVISAFPHRGLRFRPAGWLLVAIAVLAVLAGRAGADTLRSALYQFQGPNAELGQTQGDPHVYMRVSNADRLISDPANPLQPLPARGRSQFALFEFFLAPQSADHRISQVRFQDRCPSGSALTRLDAILDADVPGRPQTTGPARRPAGAATPAGFKVDLRKLGQPEGIRPGQVLGLVFKLAPSESIDTLIDDHLTRGDLQPEVRIEGLAGGAFWATAIRPITFRPGAPQPEQSLASAEGSHAAPNTVPSSQAAVGAWVSLPSLQAAHRSAPEADAKGLTLVPRGRRAREPPIRRAA